MDIESRKPSPIYNNLPGLATYVNFPIPKANQRPGLQDQSCLNSDGNGRELQQHRNQLCDKSEESFKVRSGIDGKVDLRYYSSGKPAENSGESTEDSISGQASKSKREARHVTKNKLPRDTTGQGAAKAQVVRSKGARQIPRLQLKQKHVRRDVEASTAGQDGLANYTPLYGRTIQEEYQMRILKSKAKTDEEAQMATPPACNQETRADSKADSRASRALGRLVILMIFVGVLSIAALALSALAIFYKTAWSGHTSQVVEVHNGSNVPNKTSPLAPTLKGPHATSGYQDPALSLKMCQYRVKHSWSVATGPGAFNYVTLIEEKDSKLLGVSCSTEGAQEFILTSAMKHQRRSFTCTCRGRSTLFNTRSSKMRCFLHYWECRRPKALQEDGA